MEHLTQRMRYQLITGADDADFCRRVSEALDEGYELYGSPSMTLGSEGIVVAQAMVLPAYEAVRIRSNTASTAEPVE